MRDIRTPAVYFQQMKQVEETIDWSTSELKTLLSNIQNLHSSPTLTRVQQQLLQLESKRLRRQQTPHVCCPTG